MTSNNTLSSQLGRRATLTRSRAHPLLLSLMFAAALAPASYLSAQTPSAPTVSAQATQLESRPALETELLSPTVGDLDQRLGARVESIEQVEDSETVKIYVTLPQQDGSEIEEVIVLGQPDKKTKQSTPLLQMQKFEVLNDLDEGRSGIVIYLGKKEDFVLKLNYTEPRPDVEPDLFNR
jgi:hypothetical protein